MRNEIEMSNEMSRIYKLNKDAVLIMHTGITKRYSYFTLLDKYVGFKLRFNEIKNGTNRLNFSARYGVMALMYRDIAMETRESSIDKILQYQH
jgi:hypothetical protein